MRSAKPKLTLIDLFLVVAGVAIALAPARQLIIFWDEWDTLSLVIVSYHVLVFLMPTAVMLRLRRAGYRDLYLGEGLVCAMTLAAVGMSVLNRSLDDAALLVMVAMLGGALNGFWAVFVKIWRPSVWRLWLECAPWQHWCGLGLWAFELLALATLELLDAYLS